MHLRVHLFYLYTHNFEAFILCIAYAGQRTKAQTLSCPMCESNISEYTCFYRRLASACRANRETRLTRKSICATNNAYRKRYHYNIYSTAYECCVFRSNFGMLLSSVVDQLLCDDVSSKYRVWSELNAMLIVILNQIAFSFRISCGAMHLSNRYG